jgi:hypothetical protein
VKDAHKRLRLEQVSYQFKEFALEREMCLQESWEMIIFAQPVKFDVCFSADGVANFQMCGIIMIVRIFDSLDK